LSVNLKRYWGTEAYAAAYIVGPTGEYIATIYAAGSRMKYFRHMQRWFRMLQRSGRGVDGSTGASIGSGGYFRTSVDVPDEMLNAGYVLRVETSVENQSYFPDDAAVALDDAHNGQLVTGTGYIDSMKISF
jgi:Predicted periplasmic protein (DUF2271)